MSSEIEALSLVGLALFYIQILINEEKWQTVEWL